jgi:hypothetical protein
MNSLQFLPTDINQILFNTMFFSSKYNFYLYCKENNLTEEIKYINNYYKSLKTSDVIQSLIDGEKISENLFHKFRKVISLNQCCKYKYFSEEFIIKHKNRISWKSVGLTQKLTPNIIEAYKNKINFNDTIFGMTTRYRYRHINIPMGGVTRDNWRSGKQSGMRSYRNNDDIYKQIRLNDNVFYKPNMFERNINKLNRFKRNNLIN